MTGRARIPQVLERALIDALKAQGADIDVTAGMVAAWLLSEVPVMDGGFGRSKLNIDRLVRDLERDLATLFHGGEP